jgi:PAS domain S-box-containing protein
MKSVVQSSPPLVASHPTTDLQRLQLENAGLRAELERVETERAHADRFRLLAEAMPQLVWTCLPDGRCDYLGPQWVAYTGTPEAEQLGYRWLARVHPEDRERANQAWAHLATAAIALDIDFRILAADGSYRWFKTRALPARDEKGQIVQWLGTNTDIDDLRRAEREVRLLKEGLMLEVAQQTAALRAVSHRLQAATGAAGIGIWDWNTVSDTLVWDDQMYRLYGVSASDFKGAYEAWQSALHPDDVEGGDRAIQQALAGTAEFRVQFRIKTPAGRVRHIRAAAIVYRDATGSPVRMLGTNWDITAEAEAVEALKTNEERWNLALEGTGDGVWDWDLIKDEIFLSRRSRELLGYDTDEATTVDFREQWVHPDDLDRARQAMNRLLSGESDTCDCEYRLRCRDGTYRWILGTGRAITRGADGKPLRIVGTHKDISERRRAQEALEHREALLREFITHTPAAIAMLDRELCYVQASRRWLKDYKLDGRDIIGRCHYDVFPDVPERWKQIHQRVLAGAVESCEEDPFPRADGGTEWLQWEARPWYESAGRIGGLIFFTQVVTERKQLGLRLEERNQQLSNSNAELEQFAYVASHDLQEPLRAVAGCAQILAQRYRGKLDADADNLIAHIVAGSSRMKALIEGLLSLSRVGSQQHAASSVDLAGCFQQALDNLQASIKEHAATVTAEPLPRVRGDALQLAQLFQNLIGNALKYRSAETPRITVTAKRVGDSQQVSVRDNGIGIEPQYFERIFGVFQRLHTREEYPGTGIGLAICRKIVERHRGRIWLESAPGQGTTFHFTLPGLDHPRESEA